MAKWDQVVQSTLQSTPQMIRSIVVIVFLGLVAAIIAVLSFAVLSGREMHFDVRGFGISEYHPPEVQLCTALTSTLPLVTAANDSAFKSLSQQLIVGLELHSKRFDLLRANRFDAMNAANRPGLQDTIKDGEGFLKTLENDLGALRLHRDGIVNEYSGLIAKITATCAPLKKA